MRKRAVLYARVSTEKQDAPNKVSIDKQVESMVKLCEYQGWEVAGTFIDNKKYKKTKRPDKGKIVEPSGKYDDRPAFVTMLDHLETGQADVVVYYDLYRFGRHHRVLGSFQTALDEGNKKRSGKTPIEIWEAAHNKSVSKIELGIMITIAQEENDARVRRGRMGKIGTLEKGYWPGQYNRLGYDTVKAERGRKIVLGPEEEIRTVKNIYNWYDGGMGVVQIRKRLIAEGRNQKGWQHITGRPREWSPNIVRNILRAPDYTGKATWVFNDGTEPITITIPRIISNAQWERVQKRLNSGRRLSKRNTRGVYLLQNILYCGECGGKCTARKGSKHYYRERKSGRKRYEYKTEQPFYYQCPTAAKYPEERHPHPYCHHGVKLDYTVWRNIVDKVIKHPDLIIEQVRNRQITLQTQGDNIDGDINRLQRRLAEIEQEKMVYTRQLGRGKIDETKYDFLIAECEETEKAADEELAGLLLLRDENRKVSASITYIKGLLNNLQHRLPEVDQTTEELTQLPEAEQRKILLEQQKIVAALAERVTVYADGRIEVDGLIEIKGDEFEEVNLENSGRG